MPLNNYRLRPPSTVILADDRDPYVSWQNHLARAGRGGVDIVAPVGTPVYARTAGVMLHIPNDGTAGNSCRFHHDDNPGWRDVFSHLSSYVGESGRHFNAGEIVAYTGTTGGVAPHLHWHLLDPSGVRRNPWDYFSGSAVAGIGTTPVEEPKRKRRTVILMHCDMWGDWLVVPGLSARKVGNENVTNKLDSVDYVKRLEVENDNWNAFWVEIVGFDVDFAAAEGTTFVNPALRG